MTDEQFELCQQFIKYLRDIAGYDFNADDLFFNLENNETDDDGNGGTYYILTEENETEVCMLEHSVKGFCLKHNLPYEWTGEYLHDEGIMVDGDKKWSDVIDHFSKYALKYEKKDVMIYVQRFELIEEFTEHLKCVVGEDFEPLSYINCAITHPENDDIIADTEKLFRTTLILEGIKRFCVKRGIPNKNKCSESRELLYSLDDRFDLDFIEWKYEYDADWSDIIALFAHIIDDTYGW